MLRGLRLILGVTVVLNAAQFSGFAQDTTYKWGPEQDGLRTRLVPLQSEYVLGYPVLFRLELENVSNSSIQYDSEMQIERYDFFFIVGANKTQPRYVALLNPDVAWKEPKTINPNQSVAIQDQLDLSSLYYFAQPGRYAVQFHGWPGFPETPKGKKRMGVPESNVVEIELKAGAQTGRDLFLSQVLNVIPDGWGFSIGDRSPNPSHVEPRGRTSSSGYHAFTFENIVSTGAIPHVEIWKTQEAVELVPSEKESSVVSEYVGKNSSGYIYVSGSISPEMKQRLIMAFNIQVQ